MANITGRFVADFTDFDTAVQNSVVKLKGLETESEKVEASLNRMVDQFSGRKLIQDANLMVEAIERLGGASQLTEKELQRVSAKAAEAAEKMRALGMDVPKGLDTLATATKGAGTAAESSAGSFGALGKQLVSMAASYFTVDAVIRYGKAVLEYGDAIQKAADQTGLAVEEIQSLQYISGQTGTSFSALTNAVQTLQERLGSGNTGTIAALRQLGINLDVFKTKSGYEQLVEVADKLKGVESETTRASLSASIYGKTWKEITPAILANMKELGEEAPKLSKAQVDGLDRAGDALRRYYDIAIVAGGRLAGVFIAGDTVTQAAREWQATLDAIQPPTIAFGQSLHDTAMSAEELAEAERQLEAENEANVAAAKERAKIAEDAAKELAKWAEGYERISAAGTDWHEQVARHDAQLVEHIQRNLEAGRSVEEPATAFSIAKEDVAAMKRALEEDAAMLKQHDAAARETASLMDQLFTLQIELSGTATEAAIANITLWANEYKARLMEAGTLTADSERAIEAIRAATIDRILGKQVELTEGTRSAVEQRATYERNKLDAMMAKWDEWGEAAIREQEQVAIEAEEAARDFDQSWTGALEDTKAKHRDAAQAVTLSWSQAMAAVAAGQGTMSGTLPGGPMASRATIQKAYAAGRYFGPVNAYGPDWEALGMSKWEGGMAGGGPVSAGSAYMVGERGPELFVPSQSGAIVPNGAGGMTNVFHINGTGADVARVVVSELTRLMRVGRKWPAV